MRPLAILSLKWLIAVLMLGALAWWVQTSIGWLELLRPWQQFPPAQLFLLVALTALTYLSRTLRLYDLYHPRLGGPFMLYLRINVLHTTLLNLLPMRSGEAAFPLMMKRHFSEGYLNSLTNLLWLRVADLWILLWLGLVAYTVHQASWAWTLVAVGVLFPLLLHPLRRVLLRNTHDSHQWLARLLRRLVEGLPDEFGRYLRLLLWTLTTWGLKLIAFVSVANFFIGAPALSLVPGVIAAEISNSLPIQGVAGFGNYEAAMVLGGQWSSVSNQQLLMAAVNLHLFILACTLIFGVLALMIPTNEKRNSS